MTSNKLFVLMFAEAIFHRPGAGHAWMGESGQCRQ